MAQKYLVRHLLLNVIHFHRALLRFTLFVICSMPEVNPVALMPSVVVFFFIFRRHCLSLFSLSLSVYSRVCFVLVLFELILDLFFASYFTHVIHMLRVELGNWRARKKEIFLWNTQNPYHLAQANKHLKSLPKKSYPVMLFSWCTSAFFLHKCRLLFILFEYNLVILPSRCLQGCQSYYSGHG